MTTTTITCPDCNGDGWALQATYYQGDECYPADQPCRTCDGSGELPAPDEPSSDPWGLTVDLPHVEVCTFCSGAGEVAVGYDAGDFQVTATCRRCGGTGLPVHEVNEDSERGAA